MIFDHILAWLITFGLAFSVAITDGPFGLYAKGRQLVRRKYGEDSWQDTGVGCPICLSFWFAIPVVILMGGGVSMWLSAFGFVTVFMALAPD